MQSLISAKPSGLSAFEKIPVPQSAPNLPPLPRGPPASKPRPTPSRNLVPLESLPASSISHDQVAPKTFPPTPIHPLSRPPSRPIKGGPQPPQILTPDIQAVADDPQEELLAAGSGNPYSSSKVYFDPNYNTYGVASGYADNEFGDEMKTYYSGQPYSAYSGDSPAGPAAISAIKQRSIVAAQQMKKSSANSNAGAGSRVSRVLGMGTTVAGVQTAGRPLQTTPVTNDGQPLPRSKPAVAVSYKNKPPTLAKPTIRRSAPDPNIAAASTQPYYYY